MFVFVYKTTAKLYVIFDIQFSFFFAELQMAKSHFARWHLKRIKIISARGALGELILVGEPSGDPGGTLGEPIPIPGELTGNHPWETSGNRRGSQISSLN